MGAVVTQAWLWHSFTGVIALHFGPGTLEYSAARNHGGIKGSRGTTRIVLSTCNSTGDQHSLLLARQAFKDTETSLG